MYIDLEGIDIDGILNSGACFRVINEDDDSITNIIKDRVVNFKKVGNKVFVKASNYDNLKELLYDYFDCNRDYNKINKELKSKCNDLIKKCNGYRILNQDPFEISISYIISQNNSVRRISKSINDICHDYGKKIVFENKDYYLFPTYEKLNKLTSDDFRKYGVGFRDKYIINYLKAYNGLKDLNELNTSEALKKLMNIKGIGLKVASCILLFGYGRLDVFPIDTWVKHYMVSEYNIKDDVKAIKEFALNNFGEYSGLVIQYMFHSKRNIKDK